MRNRRTALHRMRGAAPIQCSRAAAVQMLLLREDGMRHAHALGERRFLGRRRELQRVDLRHDRSHVRGCGCTVGRDRLCGKLLSLERALAIQEEDERPCERDRRPACVRS